MAAISSTGSGNWPTCLSATPTVADTVTIGAGHLVEIPSGTVGACFKVIVNNTGGTIGLHVRLGGTLVIDNETAAVYQADGLAMNPTANSTVPGVVVEGLVITRHGFQIGSATFSAPIEVRGGGRIDYRGDAAAHGTPRGMVQLGLASQTSAPNGRLNMVGSIANPAVVSKLYFSNNGTNGGGTVQADGAQFLDCGSASQDVFTWSLWNGNFTVKLVNCLFDGCGRVVNNPSNMLATHVCRYENVTVRNSVTAVSVDAIATGSGSALTTGTRTMWNVRSDRRININAATVDFSNVVVNIAAGSTSAASLFIGSSASFTRFEKFIGRVQTSFSGAGQWNLPYGTTADRLYLIASNSSNQHHGGIGASASTASSTTTITNFLVQCQTVDATGDFWPISTNPTNNQQIILRNGIALPCATDHTKQSSKIVSPIGNLSNVDLTVEHCTIFSSGSLETAIQCGETQLANIGQLFAAIRSNLGVGIGSATDKMLVVRRDNFNQQDLMAAATTDYNGKFNLDTGTDGVGYKGNNGVALVSTGTLGVHDVVADPQFVSGTTYPDLGTYYATKKGSTGSVAGDFDGYFAEAFKKNDVTGYDPAFEPDAAIDWVIAQYRPQNAALDAAHDAGAPTTPAGATMGAAPRLVVATPAPAIALTPSTAVDFGPVREGSTSPAARTVAVTNGGTGGTGALTGLSVSGAPSWLTASLDQTVDPATVTLTPTLGSLTQGTYPYDVTVSSTAPGLVGGSQHITGAFVVDPPLLGAPTLSAGTPTANAVPLTWPAATGGAPPLTYDVQYAAGASPTTWTTAQVGVTGTAYTVLGLAVATLYSFRITANDASGQQATSNVVTATTLSNRPTATSTTVRFKAYDAQDAEIVGAVIVYSSDQPDHIRLNGLPIVATAGAVTVTSDDAEADTAVTLVGTYGGQVSAASVVVLKDPP
jgi:hypothetical protein